MHLKKLTTLFLPAVVAADAWTIRSFTRNCTNPNICTYYFTIDTGSSTQHCTTVDFYTPPGNHSWYGIRCEETNDYQISWGWNYPQDFTVMTVMHESTQTEAFFGYNSPNAVNPIASYPDVGPNAVQGTGVKPMAGH